MKIQTCAQINLNNLILNLRAIRQKVSPAGIIPVVKADAYGHGAVAVTRRLAAERFKLFAVARFEEAMELRDSGIKEPILIFGRVMPDNIGQAVAADFRLSLFEPSDIRWIEASKPKKPAGVHVKMDTGMGRLGVLPDQEPDFFSALARSHYCRWEGIYSHFSTADEKDKAYAHLQLDRFHKLLGRIRKMKNRPEMIHMANSGAILDLEESYFDAVRPGILMYGHYPSPETSREIIPRPVMTLKTGVAHIRNLPAHYPVSYGRRWSTFKQTRLAVLPIGYADGLRRDLTNKGEVLIRGKRYPIVGTVTMDHIMVNVGDDAVAPGDEAIIWGESDQGGLSLIEIAASIGTIPYELTCGVSKRVKRIYIDHSE
ncbi:MAG: alanine racemase [Thermodesulfobacteriota bacterium]